MKFIEKIDKKEYEEFMQKCPNAHFMQTMEFGEIRKIKKYTPLYVGLKENGKLLCTAMLLEKKLRRNYCYYYVPRGFSIDYNNHELLKTFTDYLYDYGKKNNAVFLKIDPAIKRYNINLDGEKIDGEDNSDLIKYLESIGYKHLGFNLAFEHEQPRFTFRIDIDKPMDDVFASFHATTRKVLNKGNQYNLNIYKGDKSDIKDFYTTMSETAKREGIVQAPITYYEKFYEVFHQNHMSDLYIIKADINALKDLFKQNIDDVEKQEETNAVRLKEKENKLAKLHKIFDEINAIKEKELTLASIITVKYKDKVWTVHGGNNSKLMSLNANYLLYYNIIKDANMAGYKIVDLFGTCGIANPEPSNPIYGIHSFKKRLGGDYTEFIGEFDLIINKPVYTLYKRITPVRNKLRHAMLKRKNNK